MNRHLIAPSGIGTRRLEAHATASGWHMLAVSEPVP
jgi:hypothetical protein